MDSGGQENREKGRDMEQRERDMGGTSGEWGMVGGYLWRMFALVSVQWYQFKRGKFGIPHNFFVIKFGLL